MNDRLRRFVAEMFGTASLLATEVGSGILVDKLAGGNVAITLLGNTIPTSAIPVDLTTIPGPNSGAHFNSAVTLAFALGGDILPWDSVAYVIVQISGGMIDV